MESNPVKYWGLSLGKIEVDFFPAENLKQYFCSNDIPFKLKSKEM